MLSTKQLQILKLAGNVGCCMDPITELLLLDFDKFAAMVKE